jgi:hypothetical protein
MCGGPYVCSVRSLIYPGHCGTAYKLKPSPKLCCLHYCNSVFRRKSLSTMIGGCLAYVQAVNAVYAMSQPHDPNRLVLRHAPQPSTTASSFD